MNPFDRTTCACDSCVSCCKKQPGPLAVGDFERIAEFMHLDREKAKAFFRDSPGALVRVAGEDEPRWIRTICPATDLTGRCVFLDRDDRCQIHPVAPFGCSMFDMHMPHEIAMPRVVWYLREVESSPEYYALRLTLKPAQSYRPVSR